jgi:RNA polymerase sigma-70 factor (ECF subfamily)
MEDASVHLVARWQEGDAQAAEELYQRYAEQLIALTYRRLPGKLALRVDPEDVVQSVYRSFFAAAREGRYVLQQSGDLWRLLLTITVHKVQNRLKHHLADKRDALRDVSVDGSASVHGLPMHVLAREPSPEEAVMLSDLLEQVLTPFTQSQRRMIELKLQGYPLEEIATEVGTCRRTVCRALERFKDELSRRFGEGT